MTLLMTALQSLGASVKAHVHAVVGTSFSWLGVIAANEAMIDVWLKRGSFVFAMAASVFTIWSIVRRDRRESQAQAK